MYPEEDAVREVYRNQTDFTEKGSLLWILDRTKTRFGARLLKTWIGRPLVDRAILQERLDAVEEIVMTQSHTLDKLRTLIRKLPDLVKGLCRVQYGKVDVHPVPWRALAI
jgi:DNA mismatch repair protein MSH3